MRKHYCVLVLLALAVLQATVPTAEAKDLVFTPDMTIQKLAGRKDSDRVQLPSGKMTTVGVLRRLDAAAQKMRSAKSSPRPSPIRMQPAATGLLVNNRMELVAALKTRRDSDTVQFASGRRATVGQIRALQPYLEKRLGQKFDAIPQRPNLIGPATRVSATQDDKQFWKDVLQGPDTRILESPRGKRITVGELKQYLNSANGRASKRGVQPASAPAQEARPQ